MMIYRGYDVEKKSDGWYVYKNDKLLYVAYNSEDAALLWIDQDKKRGILQVQS